jgi:gamma-glutamyl hercynylcysteine S-oxide synthase
MLEEVEMPFAKMSRWLIVVIAVTMLIALEAPEAQCAAPDNMVLVPAGKFVMRVEYRWREGLTLDTLVSDEAGVRYRSIEQIETPAFYIDKTEVTNAQFKAFLTSSGYKPKWPENFLKLWQGGTYPEGKANHPVVWVALEDAQAYAAWAHKRLPAEAEWQKAAQGGDGRSWPWGNVYDPAKANMDSPDTRPVGSYPQGASPYGCLDMAGNVWEMTDSFATDGYHDFCWLRGGSFFLAKGSLWYMQGGPIANYQRVKFWTMTPALNRSATIGFRCAKDAR